MSKSKMEELAEFGQSMWLDSISRSMINSGRLRDLIDSGLRGLTSNPTIFDKAISSGSEYRERISELAGQGRSTFEIYDDLTVRDIQDAADMFRPVYERTDGRDGYVSLEINPGLAHKTGETVTEGRRLHRKVSRPNVMFKVPATDEGFPAVTELLSEGVNVNVTLIFSLRQYVATVDAYIRGLKKLLEKGGDVKSMASVASVFVSRIDTAVDRLIDDRTSGKEEENTGKKLIALRGRAAVANAKLIFQKFGELFRDREFVNLQNRGAPVQRVLWGSTGTKDPSYSDIKYVTELIGSPTVNTVPEHTLDAFIDYGVIQETLTEDVDKAEACINELNDLGIDISIVCSGLLDDGVAAFEKSFESLLDTIESNSAKLKS